MIDAMERSGSGSTRWKRSERGFIRITTNKKKIRESAPDRREKKSTVRVHRCVKKKIDKKKKKMP